MAILNTISLESNKQIKINGGGDLSSDGGLLLIKEFAARIGLLKLIKQLFKTNDHTTCRKHTDTENLMQMIYQIIAAYFEDDCADELINDPVLTAILEKDTLASQPTLSRFWNRMDADTLAQHDKINAKMREIVYSIKKPEQMLFDLDSTLLNTKSFFSNISKLSFVFIIRISADSYKLHAFRIGKRSVEIFAMF